VFDVAKEIGKMFETPEVVMNGEVTLEEAMEFLEGVDDALIGVVEEKPADRRPDDVGRGLLNLNHLHQVGGD
jgi:hypothetical protein